MRRLTKAFFVLLRLSIREGREDPPLPSKSTTQADWEQLFALSARQGTVLLIYGGIQHLPPQEQPPRKLKLRWVANVVRGNERWVHYKQVVKELSNLFSERGLCPVIMKGLTISSLYPVPWYREGGDIDIWLFGEGDRANKLVSSLGITVHHQTAKHSAFVFQGVTVENHRMFFDTGSLFQRESVLYKKMERMLTGMFTPDDCPEIDAGSARGLPPGAAALFLVGHTFRHFCGIDINARHLCDWVVFFEKHEKDIDSKLLKRQIEELHLEKFVTAINSFCRAHLEFESDIFAGGDDEGARKRDRKSERLILKMITRYRLVPRVHIPVVGVLRHLFLRNRIYNGYLARIAMSEFLLPELKRYAAWLAMRFRRPGTRKKP